MIGYSISDCRTEGKLGGRMGAVYKAEDTSRGRFVALRILPNNVSELQGGGYEALETDFS